MSPFLRTPVIMKMTLTFGVMAKPFYLFDTKVNILEHRFVLNVIS